MFKLNVTAEAEAETENETSSSPSPNKSGRFIMRAHQTYRVLLNAPVFPQMKVGDSRGNEPSGKSFALAVVEQGKPTPYMVKVSAQTICLFQAELIFDFSTSSATRMRARHSTRKSVACNRSECTSMSFS